jgi:predicted ATPase/DNA-binding CsgD family transcriptional regulator
MVHDASTRSTARQPARLEATLKSDLPVLAGRLIGRETEIAAACGLLARPDVRLLTLTGAGGVGKTRLALEIAARLTGPEREIYFVPLAPIRDPGLVASAMAQALGLQESQGQPILEYLKRYLHGRGALLVLDNFEQVSAAALVLSELLSACPRLKLLVTSRASLHIYGEHEFAVPPLGLPPTHRSADPADLAQSPAVVLFVERAQAARFDFALTAENAAAVGEICVRLDGLPLAIELAAARIKLLPGPALLDRLRSAGRGAGLQLLVSGARDLPVRQQTIRNTVAWSYDLLDTDEQRLFQHLAVFVGGCTLEAAEAVCGATGPGDVLTGIASLIDKNLLYEPAQSPGGDPHVRMLETIREYALERLAESGDLGAIRRAHAAYYLQMAEQAEAGLRGPQQDRWLSWLDGAHDNLRAALQWARDHHESEILLRLSSALSWYWFLRGHLAEGRRRLEEALAGSGPPVSAHSRARALCSLSDLTRTQSNFETARVLAEESAALFRTLDDRRGLAQALNNLGVVTKHQRHFAAARAQFAESLALGRAAGATWETAMALWNLGDLANAEDDTGLARRQLSESLALFRAAGDKWGMAQALNSLGEVARCQEHYAEAGAFYEESLELFQQLDNRWRMAAVRHNLGHIAQLHGDSLQALALFRESLTTYHELGHIAGMAACLAGLGGVAAAQGQLLPAARLLGASDGLFASIGISLLSADRLQRERNLARIQAQLDGAAFAAAWAEGQAATLEQAPALAQQVAVVPPPGSTPAGAGAMPPAENAPPAGSAAAPARHPDLTAREIEVLRLAAEGLTYAEMGQQLVVSRRTVDAHLRSIYSNLGVTSRSAAVRYALDHHLL